MKRGTGIVLCLLVLILLTGCAAEVNPLEKIADASGETAGFWQGLWHGVIAPVTFIISLFSDKVGIYELHNNGNWYNLGFMLGLCVILGGSGKRHGI